MTEVNNSLRIKKIFCSIEKSFFKVCVWHANNHFLTIKKKKREREKAKAKKKITFSH